MASHIVNNHIIMAFYIDCIHTDICEQSVITCWLSAIQMLIIQRYRQFPTKHANIYENCWRRKKKKRFICAKKAISKLRPHQMTCASQRASRAVMRERQNSNKQSSVYLWLFFFGWSHSVWDIACYKIMLFFFTTKTLFLSVICSITDTNNNSPWRDET